MGLTFHGHKCPAMPLGLRAGLAAMKTLGVNRALNKELFIYSETGKGHAAGCFLDGIMIATGCTYGKSNIQKLYYNKMAFTLIEATTGKAVRVSLTADFFESTLDSTFVQQRLKGVEPQNIPAEITDPLVNKILKLDKDQFLEIGKIQQLDIVKSSGTFKAKRCQACGEATFVNKLRINEDEKIVCIPCSGWNS